MWKKTQEHKLSRSFWCTHGVTERRGGWLPVTDICFLYCAIWQTICSWTVSGQSFLRGERKTRQGDGRLTEYTMVSSRCRKLQCCCYFFLHFLLFKRYNFSRADWSYEQDKFTITNIANKHGDMGEWTKLGVKICIGEKLKDACICHEGKTQHT